MGVPIPSDDLRSKGDNDYIIVQRKNKANKWKSYKMPVDTFSSLIGAVGAQTPAIYETVTGDHYIIKRAINPDGTFEIQIRYEVGYNTSFSAVLIEKQPAHIYYDRYIDIVEVAATGQSHKGTWTVDRFLDNSTPMINILQGNSRSQGEIYNNIAGYNSEVYVSSPRFIDLTNADSTFSFTSSVDISYINSPSNYRIATFRGVLIKDGLSL